MSEKEQKLNVLLFQLKNLIHASENVSKKLDDKIYKLKINKQKLKPLENERTQLLINIEHETNRIEIYTELIENIRKEIEQL